jgi:anti-sigma regulatory factor (Ser/Thr protein kinase)
MMDDNKQFKPLKLYFTVEQGDFIRAGEASSKIKKVLSQLGFPCSLIRRVAIAAYEAEMNIVIHSWGGELEAEIGPEHVTIVARDRGPGISDIALAMEEGYSTAPDKVREMGFGAGMGLPNIQNCATEFIIESGEGRGTVLRILIAVKE